VPKLCGTADIRTNAAYVRQSLMAAKLRGNVLRGMSDGELEHVRCVILSNRSNNSKAEALGPLFGGHSTFKETRYAATYAGRLWERLESQGNRKFELDISDEVYAAIPELALARIIHVLSFNFSSLYEGMDYTRAAGRSVYLNLPEPRNMAGRVIRQIKLKGVCFDADKPLSPFLPPTPWINIVFDQEGRIKEQRIEPYKPMGTMELNAAANEFSMMRLAFRQGAKVLAPLGAGTFPGVIYDTKGLGSEENVIIYTPTEVGFAIHGMEGSERDLRAAFTELVGEGRVLDGRLQILVDPEKAVANREKIKELFMKVGRAYRELNDIGLIQGGALHPGNILVTRGLDVFLPDFEYSRSIKGTTPIQSAAYRADQVRSFVWPGIRMHFPFALLCDMRQHMGIDLAQLFLEGYFHDRPSRDYRIDILGPDTVHDLLVAMYEGKNVTDHPLMEELMRVAEKQI